MVLGLRACSQPQLLKKKIPLSNNKENSVPYQLPTGETETFAILGCSLWEAVLALCTVCVWFHRSVSCTEDSQREESICPEVFKDLC